MISELVLEYLQVGDVNPNLLGSLLPGLATPCINRVSPKTN